MCQGTSMYLYMHKHSHVCAGACKSAQLFWPLYHHQNMRRASFISSNCHPPLPLYPLEPGAREKTVVFCKPSSTQEHVGSIAYCYNLTNIVKDFTINTTEAFFRILSQSAGSQTLRRRRPRDNSNCTH